MGQGYAIGQVVADQLAVVDRHHMLRQGGQRLADFAVGDGIKMAIGQCLQRGVLPVLSLAFREAGRFQGGQSIAFAAATLCVGQRLGFQFLRQGGGRETHADSSSPVNQP